jgi:hypothetical protein
VADASQGVSRPQERGRWQVSWCEGCGPVDVDDSGRGFFAGNVEALIEWIKQNSDAQVVGLLMHEFPQFSFVKLGKLTVFQKSFLLGWLAWWNGLKKGGDDAD